MSAIARSLATIAILLLSLGAALAQPPPPPKPEGPPPPQCPSCESHCGMVGSAANAKCVASGIDPPLCGPGHHLPPKEVLESLPKEAFLAPGPGQNCTTQGICYQRGKTAERACLNACYICWPLSAHPDFVLVSILYAPPGNASSSSFGQSTTAGVTTSIGWNISNSDVTSLSSSGGGNIGILKGGFSGGESNGTSSGSGGSSSVTISTTTTNGSNLKSLKDPVDHTQDQFLVWVNPLVTLTKYDAATLMANVAPDGRDMLLIPVTAGQLMNGIPAEKLGPQKICPTHDTCATYPGLSVLTKADIADLLAQDPFLAMDGKQLPDPKRYLYLESRPLENTTVAGNLASTFSVSDSQATTTTNTQSLGGTTSETVGLSVSVMGFGIDFKDNKTWTWTDTISKGTTAGQGQQVSVTLSSTSTTCCGVTPATTCYVSIWEDMVYRTLVFVPQPETCNASLLATPVLAPPPKPAVLAAGIARSPVASSPGLQGAVTRAGKPATGQPVTVSDATGKTLARVYTDHLGRYATGAMPAGPVSVQVLRTKKSLSVEPGKAVSLDFGL